MAAHTRESILEAVAEFAQAKLENNEPFRPGETPVPVAGKVLDPNDFVALVDAALTAGSLRVDSTKSLRENLRAMSALAVPSLSILDPVRTWWR